MHDSYTFLRRLHNGLPGVTFYKSMQTEEEYLMRPQLVPAAGKLNWQTIQFFYMSSSHCKLPEEKESLITCNIVDNGFLSVRVAEGQMPVVPREVERIDHNVINTLKQQCDCRQKLLFDI